MTTFIQRYTKSKRLLFLIYSITKTTPIVLKIQEKFAPGICGIVNIQNHNDLESKGFSFLVTQCITTTVVENDN